MTDDRQLLEQFTRDRSEPAFGELVARYIDLVYSVALRRVNGDTHLAQDITQSVFMDLARKAARLPSGVVLAGWLHRHTCFTASTAIRTERRRKTREQTAMELRALDDHTAPQWEQIAPYIDDGLNRLNPSDRDALVLRFLKRQDLRAVGAALGISEGAAQKRVTRALEKLRGVLSARGVALTAVALASVLAAAPAIAAPAGLAASVTMASFSATAKTGTTLTLLKLMASTKLQSSLVAALVIASLVTPLAVQHQAQAALNIQDNALRQQAARLAELQQEHAQLTNTLAAAGSSPSIPGDQFNEILRLRGEISLLDANVRELTAAKTNRPLSRTEALDSLRQMYRDRVDSLKQQFAANPAIAVPEIQYLTYQRWLESVEYDHHVIDPDDRSTLASIRNSAQADFAHTLGDALWRYGKSNNGQFPTDLSQLSPFFHSPVDDAVLQDWEIIPTSSLPEQMRVSGQWAITQKAPVDVENDQRVAVGMNGIDLGRGGASQWDDGPR